MKYNRLLKHFHLIQMDMPNQNDLYFIYSKLVNRHFIGDTGESQLAFQDSNENLHRISTAKSSTITAATTTTTTTTTIVSTTTTTMGINSSTFLNETSNGNLSLKDKLSRKALKHLENIRFILEKLVKSTIELNERMRNLYQINCQRLHYVFTMKQISQLFRNFCLSLTSESTIDDILSLWHHEILWNYGKRLSNLIDYQRFQQLYQTIIKKYFTNLINEQEILLDEKQFFSNLQLTESGQSIIIH